MSILQGYSLLLVMSIVVVVTEAIFYTNSKENDYPRLGRRKRPTDEVHWQNEKDIYAVIKSRELTNTESLEPLRYLALFYTLDRNSKYLSSIVKLGDK